MNTQPTIEGLRAARNLLFKQWKKERQRAVDLKKRNEELQVQLDLLKKKIKFLSKRYIS